MRYVSQRFLASRTQPEQLPCRGIIALAPLVMLVWLVFWLGSVSHACCLPLLFDKHHSSHTDERGSHHDGELAALKPVAPMDHGSCLQMQSADLVPVSTEALKESSQKPILIALLALAAPLPIFITPSSPPFYQQTHSPPSRYLRNRRLLI